MVIIYKQGLLVGAMPGLSPRHFSLPTSRFGQDTGPLKIFRLPTNNNPLIEHDEEFIQRRSINVSFGVSPADSCQLSCPYCYNRYWDEGLIQHSNDPHVTAPVRQLVNFVHWVSSTRSFWLDWVIGEPFTPVGLNYLNQFVPKLSDSAVNNCKAFMLFTNGLAFEEVPDCVRRFKDLEIRMTFHLCSSQGGHLSVEQNFDQLKRIAKKLGRVKPPAKKSCTFYLPTKKSMHDCADLLEKSAELFAEIQPNVVVPGYIFHYESRPKFKEHHGKFYPENMELWYDLCFRHKIICTTHWNSTFNHVNAANQTIFYRPDGTFMMPNLKSVDPENLTGCVDDYLTKKVFNVYMDRCRTCHGFSNCPCVNRQELHQVFKAAAEIGCDDSMHTQMADLGLWATNNRLLKLMFEILSREPVGDVAEGDRLLDALNGLTSSRSTPEVRARLVQAS